MTPLGCRFAKSLAGAQWFGFSEKAGSDRPADQERILTHAEIAAGLVTRAIMGGES